MLHIYSELVSLEGYKYDKFINISWNTHRENLIYLYLGDTVYRICCDREKFSCEKEEGELWVTVEDPDLMIGHYLDKSDCPKEALWFLELPDEVRKCLINSRYLQLTALWLLGATVYASDLLKSVPVLFWLLCDCLYQKTITHEEAIILVKSKRSLIIQTLMGDTVYTPRFMGKIDFQISSKDKIEAVKTLLFESKQDKSILHSRIVDYELRYAFRSGERWLSSKLVSHCLKKGGVDLLEHAEYKTILLHATSDEFYPPIQAQEVLTCNTFKQLDEKMDYLFSRPDKQSMSEVKGKYRNIFPPPPFPGTADIIPICALKELEKEGNEMDHCVTSLAGDVYNGKQYFYKVVSPQRATVGISIGDEGQVNFECKLKNNKEPSKATIDIVKSWLNQVQPTSTAYERCPGAPCKKWLIQKYGEDFPPVFLEGSLNIVPIENIHELEDEADEMLNCVFSMAESVYKGQISCYRVLAPERATLEVYLGSSGCYEYECKLDRAEDPDIVTITAIESWLENAIAFPLCTIPQTRLL